MWHEQIAKEKLILETGNVRHLLINLKDKIFDTAVGTSPNSARMCG